MPADAPPAAPRTILVGLFCLALLGACTAEADQATEEPVLPGPTSFRLDLPLDEYKLTPNELWTIERARHVLLERCVLARDIEFTMPAITRTVEPPDVYDNSRRYGVADKEAVAVFGYHLPRTADGRRRQREIDEWNESLTRVEEAAIYGTSDDPGCFQHADTELADGVPEADTGWLAERSVESLDEAAKSPAVAEAKAGWRTCMADRGFTYRDPPAATDDWDLESTTISEQEIATALADVRCKYASGLVTAYVRFETAWQRRLIDREPERFDQLEAAKKATLANARQVTG